jgi:RNA polymerase sigma factor (sigma-70 family)
MQTKSDAQLLREYARQRSEPAFAEIVARHADLVYSAAWRQTASPELAREIAQSVFTDLARKARALAGSLPVDASLTGWLYRGTRFAGLTLLRSERRRHAHERHVMEHSNSAHETAPDWERVGPLLDEAMAELADADREAVLLRYFKNEDFFAVGRALGVTDDAAQKRVSRAVERLREFLAKRGITIGTHGLVVVIAANAVQATPIGLSAAITAAALAGTTIFTTTTVTGGFAVVLFAISIGLVFLCSLPIKILDSRFHVISVTASRGTNQAIYLENQGRLKESLRKLGLGGQPAQKLMIKLRDNNYIAISVVYTGNLAPQELETMAAELEDSAGKVTRLEGGFYAPERKGKNHVRSWLQDLQSTNKLSYRLRLKLANDGRQLAEIKLGKL